MAAASKSAIARLLAFLATFLLVGLASAQELRIYAPPSKYIYHGCYNETTGLPGTAGGRAIVGKSVIAPGNLTAQSCIDFCSFGSTVYKYAGAEFGRECWCGNLLSGLSTKVADSQCNMPCDGDSSIACGGALKLSVYIAGNPSSAANTHGAAVMAPAVVLAIMLLVV